MGFVRRGIKRRIRIPRLHSPTSLFPTALLDMPLASSLQLVKGVGTATHIRSTIGTYRDRDDSLVKTAAINIPRFETAGLLMEGAGENLIRRSEEFQSTWVKSRSSVDPNVKTAPDGILTGDKFLEDSTATSTHLMRLSATKAASALPYTFSIFVNKSDHDEVQLRLTNAAQTNLSTIFFNVTAGTVGTISNSGFTGAAGTIEVFPNGWFLCTMTATSDTDTLVQSMVFLSEGSESVTYSGDGTSGIFLWGAPLEQSPFRTSYIKTGAASDTRGFDDLSISSSNIPAPTADYSVCMTVDALGFDSTASQVLFNVDGETSRRIQWNTTTGAIEAIHGAVTSTSTSTFSAGTSVDICFVVDGTNQTLYINGVQEDQDAKGTVTGTATAIDIGHQAGSNQAFSHIKDLKTFDVALTVDQI